MLPQLAFMQILGNQTQVLMLAWQVFYPLDHLLSFRKLFLIVWWLGESAIRVTIDLGTHGDLFSVSHLSFYTEEEVRGAKHVPETFFKGY